MPASINSLHKMAVYMGIVSGGGCAMMYYLMQKNFARSEYYHRALEQLRDNHTAMESLGAPPLQVHNVRLTDRHNRVDKTSAKIKIPVSGTKSAGYLYTYSIRDTIMNRWCLQEVVLQLRDGQRIEVYEPSVDDDEVKQEECFGQSAMATS
ncbi:Cytochrome c oxidase assembly factor 1-like [Acipenser ruthenus]|uniref:Cytochrome c oxidase assembly factor 1-like n=2 Tax=Acipenser TaxID=7901 RepID=A0A662YV63_ACIRT|nr:cytochrome c oxidase assembly factor 1 homolog [Acipenser ruthenus]XP_033914411.1 cytochrome c oxidase assembly factor 1 homolog [Acipenser ruthenus]XP_033914412.1 cytochrome c oxidase assembly factor 1 homolog [Acipenser ruthenus]KAK1173626.1 hypothetical protein AOXY_G3786 [Acipenser oxyrinchus oxyrinchus]RXN00016.1 Cytochrome c oxidase assembly factor 1-like [Acipenser ruthenus]